LIYIDVLVVFFKNLWASGFRPSPEWYLHTGLLNFDILFLFNFSLWGGVFVSFNIW